jgi:uncharacterized protein YukE
MAGQYGDPAAAAAAAAQLRKHAQTVGDLGSQVGRRFGAMTFEGKGATEVGGQVHVLSNRTKGLATVLSSIATDMTRIANEAKADQEAEQRRLAKDRFKGGHI